MKVHHIVLAKFPQAKAHRGQELLLALDQLRQQMNGFLDVCGGPYASPEGLNAGFTHGYLMTFSDAETRNHYLTHPEHEKIKQAFLPDVEGVIAFDFEVS